MSRGNAITLRSRTMAIVGVVLLLGSAVVGCGEQPADPPSAAASPSASGPRELTITESSANHDSGTFARAATTIIFEAKAVTPAQTEFALSMNGKRFSASKDTEKATSRWSGGGAVLQQDDRAALKAFSDALNATWNQPAGSADIKIPAHRDLTLRMAALLAEAPLGVAIGDQVAPGSR